jgi:pimeloyl-ACP methyl ester carboxylesterase
MPTTPTSTSDRHHEEGGTRTVNGVRLYYEERGRGAPILCIHGGGSSALMWADAVEGLARLGRVISYDRRGCTRSERPEPYERTSVAEQADDAAALLDALAAAPAVVIGRSYGGAVAIDLALRYPDRVRALVLLEGDALGLSPAALEWTKGDGRSPPRGGSAGRHRRGLRGADRRGARGLAFVEEVLESR